MTLGSHIPQRMNSADFGDADVTFIAQSEKSPRLLDGDVVQCGAFVVFVNVVIP